MNLARLTGQAYAQRIEVARQLLIALANHPGDARSRRGSLRPAGPDACRGNTKGIYARIGRATADGIVDCLALEGAAAGMSIADRDYFQRAKATGKFVAGDFMRRQGAPQPTLAFAHAAAATRPATITHVIFANADLTVLSHALEADSQLEGTTISLLDRKGALIARSTDADKFFGVKASAGNCR